MNLYESIKLSEDGYNRYAGIEFKYYKDKSAEICAAIEQYFRGAGFHTYNLHGHTKLFYYEQVFTVEVNGGGLESNVCVILGEMHFNFRGIEPYFNHDCVSTIKGVNAIKKLMTVAMKFKDSELLLNAIKDSKSED